MVVSRDAYDGGTTTSLRVPPLETARLLIREFTLADLPLASRLTESDPDAAADWLRWTISGYQQLALLRQPPFGDRAIAAQATGELVGACGYAPLVMPFAQIPGFGSDQPPDVAVPSSAEVGLYWSILPEHRRRGYATEAAQALVDYALRSLCVARVVATTTYANVASIGVMRKLGMRVERNPRSEPAWLQIVGILESRA